MSARNKKACPHDGNENSIMDANIKSNHLRFFQWKKAFYNNT